MAATFSFSTTTILSGHSIRVYNTSTNWSEYDPNNSTGVTLTMTTLDEDAIFIGASNTFTKTYIPQDLVGDFLLDVSSLEMFGADGIVPDDIVNVKIDIETETTPLFTYNTDEVFYYNAWAEKCRACYNAVNFICDMNCLEIKYACMVNILYQGLMADISTANTSGIYEKFDIFTRLSQQ